MRASHVAALSALLAHDRDAGQLHSRHLLLLSVFASAEVPLTVEEAAVQADLSYQQAARVVRRLTEGEYVTRQYDGKRFPVIATRKGRDLDNRVRGYVAAATKATSTQTEDTKR